MFPKRGFDVLFLVALPLFFICGLACSGDPGEPAKPSGSVDLEVTNFSGCKHDVAKVAGASSIDECIQWQYSDGVLQINHVNAGFNCCVTALLAGFDKDGDSITITESENLESGGCHCLCLYDFDYQINNLGAAEYTITIIGPYMETNSTPESDYLSFTIDLVAEPSGSYCVERDHYPWI